MKFPLERECNTHVRHFDVTITDVTNIGYITRASSVFLNEREREREKEREREIRKIYKLLTLQKQCI